MQGHDPQQVREQLVAIWSEVLEIAPDRIPLDRNFFTLGGDSIRLMQVMDRVNSMLGTGSSDEGLPLTDFFSYATIRELTERVTANARAPAPTSEGAHAPRPGAIAVIGMAGRFPGAADLYTFWKNLRAGAETLQFFSAAQLMEGGATAEELADPRYVRCAGLVDDVQCLDAEYFGLTAVEAALLAPEQRLLLECAQEALDEAGYGLRWRGERVGVFAGFGLSTYLLDNLVANSRALESASGMRVLLSNTSPATRISYLLNLTGPSITLDTACSSSLVAVHQACRSILNGECDMALAGGSTVRRFGPRGYRAEEGGIFSPDGHCRPFDRQAQGTVATSGAGMVLLKPLDAALADRDSIHAVILGTAINNDGNTKVGYTAPSVTGQAAAIRSACAMAGVDPRSLQYVETHGTATALGDMIEIAALNDVFGSSGAPARCALGTLKANVGHLEAAAGVASLMKASLALQHREIPPAIHFHDPNPQIDFERTPFYLNPELQAWAASDVPRRAGVSSFGIGGTNAHVVLQEAPRRETAGGHRDSQLLVLSARSRSALQASSLRLVARLAAEPPLQLEDVAYSLQVGRAAQTVRRFCVCDSTAEAVRLLEADDGPDALQELSVADGVPVVFVFPGGNAWDPRVGRGIYDSEPVFREHIDQCAQLLQPLLQADVREILFAADPLGGERRTAAALSRNEAGQALLFAVEYSLAQLWQSWGVVPSIVIGHDVGEFAAACLTGVLTPGEALALVCARGCLTEFTALLEHLPAREANIPFAASLTGRLLDRGTQLASDYWLGHFRPTLGPAPGLGPLMQGSRKVFLEVGPAAEPIARMRETGAARRHIVIPSCRDPAAGDKDSAALMRAVGRLWLAGATIDWSQFNARNACRRVALPSYPFERRKHWIDREEPRAARTPVVAPGIESAHRVPERSRPISDWFYVPVWKQRPARVNHGAQAQGTCVLFDDGAAVGEALMQGLARRFSKVVRVRAGDAYEEGACGFSLNPVEFSHYARLMATLAERQTPIDSIVHAWLGGAPAQRNSTGGSELAAGFYSSIYLCQALEEYHHGRPISLTMLTNEAHVILGEERGSPHAAMLSACARVISREFPNIACRSIDVSLQTRSPQEVAKLIDAVVSEACGRSSEPVLAYRGSCCFVPAYEPLAPVTGGFSSPLPRSGGTYLISGGLGGIGLTLAELLGRSCAARIVLTSRAEFPPRTQWDRLLAEDPKSVLGERIRKVRAIEAHGAQVFIVQADVCDPGQVRAALARTLERFGALNGVIHAAGVPAAGVIALKSYAMAQQVMAPKVEGTLNLLAAVSAMDLDFFICCSSIAAILAPPGQVDYCAANAFQDAVSHMHDRLGRTRFISINWDGWSEVGMALSTSVPAPGGALDHGLSCAEGCEVFRMILQDPRPQWIISTRGLKETAAGALPEPPRTAPRPQSSTMTEEEALADIWQDLLGVAEPGINDDFFALGGDSLLAIQLSAQLERRFGASVPIRQLLRTPTIASLAKLLRTGAAERRAESAA